MSGGSLVQGWRVFALAMRSVYDYLGMVMVVSALWFLVGFVPVAFAFNLVVQVPSPISIVLFLFIVLTLGAPATAAAYALTGEMAEREDVAVWDFFARFGQHFFRSVKLTAVMLAILVVLVTDIAFFWRSSIWLLRWGATFIWLEFLLFWALMSAFVFPIAIKQHTGVLKTLQRAALLTLDNIVVALWVLFIGLLAGALSYVLRVPLFLLFMGTIGFLHNLAFRELLRRYAGAQPNAQVAPESGESV